MDVLVSIRLVCILGLFASVASIEYDVALSGAEYAQRALTWDLPLDQSFSAWLGTHNRSRKCRFFYHDC